MPGFGKKSNHIGIPSAQQPAYRYIMEHHIMREIAFVPVDLHGKTKASDRKLIRSHCSTL